MKNTVFLALFSVISIFGYAGTPKSVNIVAGSLSSSLTSAEFASVTDLTISGSMDARDFKTIRDNMSVLSMLDLSGAVVASYSGTLGTASSGSVTYAANAIPAFAFYSADTQRGNTTLTDIKFPAELISVGDYAFRGCSGLTTLTIPLTVTNIGGYAFSGCSGVDVVSIPKSVNVIGDYAFSGCSGHFLVDINNPVYVGVDDMLFNKTLTSLIQCPVSKVGTLTIPSTVTAIGNGAFQNCSGLVGLLSIPASVSTIGYYAFSGCLGFSGELIIPSAVKSVGAFAFSGCTGLTSLTVSSLHIADASSFPNQQITRLKLNGVVDARDFKILRDDMAALTEVDLSAATVSAYTGTLGTAGTGTISYSANTIPVDAFRGCVGLTVFSIPLSVTSIDEGAYRGCKGFTGQLVIPEAVTSIGAFAFEGCTGLTSLNASSLHLADATAFDHTAITKLTLTGTINASDFKQMRDRLEMLAEIDLSASSIAAYTGTLGPDGDAVVSYPANGIPAYAFFNAETQTGKTRLTSLRLPSGLTYIGNYAFRNCTGLTSLPSLISVSYIGNGAFQYCTGLTGSLVIPSAITTIESSTFDGCTGFIGALVVPSSVTSIGAFAFNGCAGLTSLAAPSLHLADATSFQNTGIRKLTLSGMIDARDFKIARDNLSLLETIDLSNADIAAYTGTMGTENAGNVTYPARAIPDYAFLNPDTQKRMTTLTAIHFPDNLVSIGDYAFYGCNKVESISLPASVSSIGNYAFSGCSGLFQVDSNNAGFASLDGLLFSKDLTKLIQSPVSKTGSLLIPSSVQTIGNGAYMYCAGYTGFLTIPSSVISIGENAFYGCTGLESMMASSLHMADVTSFENSSLAKLTLTGEIDARDFRTMRDHMSVLAEVDLSAATIVGYTGTQGTAGTNSISYPASSIPVYAFHHPDTQESKSSLRTIKFPAELVSIGEYAFRGCSGLTALSIPLSVTSIGGGVFMDCTGLTGELVIPSSITSIGSRAFQGCTGFTEPLIIPSSVTAIGTMAFAGCTGLKSLTASSLHIADASSFQNTSISRLTLTNTIDARDFRSMRDDLPMLSEINLSRTTVDAYTGTLGTLNAGNILYPANVVPACAFFNPDSQTGKTTLKTIDFPSGLVSVGDDAFRNGTGLTAVVIPSTVSTIGSGAFQGCTGLMSVPFTKAITSVGSSAFRGCTGLTGLLEIPSTIHVIEPYLFEGCTNLTSLIIPRTIDSVGAYAFANCTGLVSLTAPSLHFADETSFPQAYIKRLTLTGTIDAGEFRTMRDDFSVLAAVDLLNADIAAEGHVNTANAIPDFAFYHPATKTGKKTLETFVFPASLVSVEDSAFMDCTGLTSISIPSLVQKIGKNAFDGCSKVDTSVISPSVNLIEDYAFSGCSGFFNVNENNRQYSSVDGVLFNKVKSRLIQCPFPKIGTLSIPSSVTEIGCGAFQNCTGLIDSLAIPSSVISIETLAFSGCTGFKGMLEIPSPVDSIGVSAFAGCAGLTSLKAQSLHIADATAFDNTPIAKIILNGTINAIDFKRMRDNLSVLAEADLSVSKIAAYSGTLGTAGSAFVSYPAKTIPSFALNEKTTLTSFHFPDELTAIGNHAFEGCTGLSGVHFPESLTSIGNASFYGCTGLAGLLTIPSLMTVIDTSAFQGCTGLTALTAPALHIADITSFPYDRFTKLTLFGTIDARDFKVIRDHMSVLADLNLSTVKISAYTGLSGTGGVTSLSYPANGIPVNAFYFSDIQSGKTTLTNVVLPSGLVSIGDQAFRYCSEVSSICIPASVTSIGHYAFLKFGGLIHVDEGNEAYASLNGVLFNKVLTKVIQCPTSVKGDFLSPISLTTVGNGAFFGCSGLTSIRIPSSVHIIGDSAFRDCKALEQFYAYKVIPVDLTSSIDVFKGINLNTCKLYVPDGALSDYELAPKWRDFLNTTTIERILLDTLEMPEAGCDGHNQDLSYRILSGNPNQYQVTFDEAALSKGFQNVTYTNLPSLDPEGVLPFEVPLGTPYGSYIGYIQMRDAYGLESLPYAFHFTVNLSADSLIAKFDDVLVCDNSSKEFVRYQWFKNGESILGATRQYYSDPEGLVGSYSIKVWTADDRELNSCLKELNIPLVSKITVTVSPNPVLKGQPCTIKLTGLSEEELQGTTLSLFDMNGISVYSSDIVKPVHTFSLSGSAGVYVGNITTLKGEKVTFEVVVTE